MIPGTNRERKGGYFYAPLYRPYDFESLEFFLQRVIPGPGNFKIMFMRNKVELEEILRKIWSKEIHYISSYREMKNLIDSKVKNKIFLVKFYKMIDDIKTSKDKLIREFIFSNKIIDDELDIEIGENLPFFAIENLNIKIEGIIARINKLQFIGVKKHILSFPVHTYIPEKDDIRNGIKKLNEILGEIYDQEFI